MFFWICNSIFLSINDSTCNKRSNWLDSLRLCKPMIRTSYHTKYDCGRCIKQMRIRSFQTLEKKWLEMITYKEIPVSRSRIAEEIRQSNKDARIIPMESTLDDRSGDYLKYLSSLSKFSKDRRSRRPEVRFRKNSETLSGNTAGSMLINTGIFDDIFRFFTSIGGLISKPATYFRTNQTCKSLLIQGRYM